MSRAVGPVTGPAEPLEVSQRVGPEPLAFAQRGSDRQGDLVSSSSPGFPQGQSARGMRG